MVGQRPLEARIEVRFLAREQLVYLFEHPFKFEYLTSHRRGISLLDESKKT